MGMNGISSALPCPVLDEGEPLLGLEVRSPLWEFADADLGTLVSSMRARVARSFPSLLQIFDVLHVLFMGTVAEVEPGDFIPASMSASIFFS